MVELLAWLSSIRLSIRKSVMCNGSTETKWQIVGWNFLHKYVINLGIQNFRDLLQGNIFKFGVK